MTPELRNAVFSFKLFSDSINSPSNWLPAGQKRDILTALQELFVKLAFIDEAAISTQNLTNSFGWTGEEVIVQHDVQELSRVFFDCLDRALQGTEYSGLINQFIKGKFTNIIKCNQCGNESAREEEFADIGLRVKNCKNLESSIENLLNSEVMDGPNQYFCSLCQGKVDAVRATKISKLPPLLYFSLNRFEYDTKNYERVKINSNFEYPLELDMSKYCTEASVYELFGVIIHGGGAHSGHYHAYIRDILGEGVWEPGMVVVQEKPKVNETRPGKKNKKKNRGKKRAQKVKKEVKPEPNFDNEEFSNDCSDPRLLINWYDFNDTTVSAIRSGKLKKQFGGTNETAYILIYRSKQLENLHIPEIPSYWVPAMTSLNDDYKKHRIIYEEQKNILEVQIQTFDLFEVDDEALLYVDKETCTLNQGISLRLDKNETIEDLRNQITISLIEDFPDVFETHEIYKAQPLSNKCLQLLRPLDSFENSWTLSQSSITHKTCLAVLPKSDPTLTQVLQFIGPDCEPLTITCNFQGEKFFLISNKTSPFSALKSKILSKLKFSSEKLEFKYRKSEGTEKRIQNRDEDLTLDQLKFYHSITLNINLKDSDIPMVELKKSEQGEELATVLLTDELDPEKPVQHLVIKDWRVKDLIQEVRTLFKIEESCPVRLRKLIDKKIVCKEDLDGFLKNIPEFLEGGYRFQVERGEPPSYGLIVLKVAFDCNDPGKEIFVKETEKISDVKMRAAEVLGFQPELFKLYRTDWLKDPICALKQETQTLFKAAVKDSDFLLVKSIDTVVESETTRVQIFINNPLYPSDNRPVLELSIPEDAPLKTLKEMLKTNPELNPSNKEHIRIRELTKTLWPGKVYKEENKSIKKLSITFGANLLVEPLDLADSGSFTGIHIFIGERNSIDKSNKNIVQSFFDAGASPSIDHLYKHVIEALGKDWELGKITVARFKANSFEWEILKDERTAEEKGKLLGVKGSSTAQGVFNLKKKPYFIKDGDFFSVKLDDEENKNDDFVCKGDNEARKLYMSHRQNQSKGKKPAKPEKSIKIGDF